MKYYFLLILVAINISYCLAQSAKPIGSLLSKPNLPVDTATFFHWPKIHDFPSISNDGKYGLYYVKNIPAQSGSVIVKALNSDWKVELSGVQGQAFFTSDSRRVVFMHAKDSLCILKLKEGEKKYITGVRLFQMFTHASNDWIVLQMKNLDHELILQNLKSEKQYVYKNVATYVLSADGNTIVFQTIPDFRNAKNVSIQWVDLSTFVQQEVWKGTNVSNILMNSTSSQLAFITEDSNVSKKKLWIYNHDSRKSEAVIDPITSMPDDFELAGISNFSTDNRKLFIRLRKKILPKSELNVVPLNIWSYLDAKLQSQQLMDLSGGGFANPYYIAIVDLSNKNQICWMQQENENISLGEGSKADDFILLVSRKGDRSERYWNKEATGSTWLVSLVDGNRKQLPISRAKFSPTEKYVIGYDADETWRNMFVYEIATGVVRNITKSIPIPDHDPIYDLPLENLSRGFELAAWLTDDAAILMYDQYDIWQVDPTGKKKPVNLTHGRSKGWQFRLANESDFLGKVIVSGESLLLHAFNKNSKQSGFYQLKLGKMKDPELLFRGNYMFKKFMSNKYRGFFLKAQNANVHLVIREHCQESPNVFSTLDFKHFNPISDVYPERTVNWYTSELINFTTSEGIQTQAVLYKPGNFDSTMRYPLIIHYYDKKSDLMNKYHQPAEPNGELDVPWFASRGYLVLLTDIHYTVGEVGKSVYESVVGAAKYLGQRPYVDKEHIGIQGHSFGGYETNYLITQSDMFAAAVSSSGPSDLTSFYGNIWGQGNSKQYYLETDRLRIGATPWERPDLYVKNTPIFYVNQVSSPILMIHNKDDRNCHFDQGLEFFTALRRAGKRVWMLEYDNGGHGLLGRDYQDYLLRMTQFFDHYLKNAPPPKWMTRGVPASMKGRVDGFELDEEIKTPREGLLIK